jgi:hypothetical protein
MNAGKQALAMKGGPDDPFTSTTTYTTPQNGRSNNKLETIDSETEGLLTPDSVHRRTIAPVALAGSPDPAPCFPEDSSTILQRNMLAGQSSLTPMSDFRRHLSGSHDAGPTMENNVRAGLDGSALSRFQYAHLMAPNTPEFSPKPRPLFNRRYHAACSTDSDATLHRLSRAVPSQRMAAPTSHPCRDAPPTSIPPTPTSHKKVRPYSTNTGQRRKRGESDSDDSEYLPPAKKSYHGGI